MTALDGVDGPDAESFLGVTVHVGMSMLENCQLVVTRFPPSRFAR
jgi:hypothetical protein